MAQSKARSMAAWPALVVLGACGATIPPLHVLLVMQLARDVPFWQALVFGLLVSLGGAGLGFVDEVKGNGSIVPAWLAHGTLNLVTYLWVRWG